MMSSNVSDDNATSDVVTNAGVQQEHHLHKMRKQVVKFASDDATVSKHRGRLVRTPTPFVKQQTPSFASFDDSSRDADIKPSC